MFEGQYCDYCAAAALTTRLELRLCLVCYIAFPYPLCTQSLSFGSVTVTLFYLI